MSADPVPAAEADEMQATAVALLRATLAGDQIAVDALLVDADPAVLLPVMTGLAVALLDRAGVPGAALDSWCQQWQAERAGRGRDWPGVAWR